MVTFRQSTSLLIFLIVCGAYQADAEAMPDSQIVGGQYALNLDLSHYQLRTVSENGKTLTVRAYEQVVYVGKPVDISTQAMNIYIPEAYFHGGSVGHYNAHTAPIFLPNNIGGYMPARPASLDGPGMPPDMPFGRGAPDKPAMSNKQAAPEGRGMPRFLERPNTIALALLHGYVVAAPGARGRTSIDKAGRYIGKAPAAIVDLKAAVRFLRFNDAVMPGDAEKIISNGTSAGGALSALLGASGNNPDYQPALAALGAAEARDDIYAVSAYCPITNLDHADAAYEWQFDGIYDYKRIDMTMLDFHVARKEVAGVMDDQQIAVSRRLKALFPAYVNSLHLKGPHGEPLTLDDSGNGSFKEYLKAMVMSSAQTAMKDGVDLTHYSWLQISDGRITGMDYDQYLRYLGRQKTAPAFDGLDLKTGENQLFGNDTVDSRHFTAFSVASGGDMVEEEVVQMMNPMHYLGAADTNNARYWRIRHGTKDRDTSLAIPLLLATALENRHISVDVALPWDRPHSGDYDLDALFAWIDNIAK
jgi:hypothetical protein